jgi:hypothetical protein
MNQGFSYYFCMMIEGSGSESGSIPLTNGSESGSRKPKNIWIRWIRIRNTAFTVYLFSQLLHLDILILFGRLLKADQHSTSRARCQHILPVTYKSI